MEEFASDRRGQNVISLYSPGAEDKAWRQHYLLQFLEDHLPEFAGPVATTVPVKEIMKAVRDAARRIYKLPKDPNSRGEIGELLLHSLLSSCIGTNLLVSKIFFEDSPNDVPKGYDAVFIDADNNSVNTIWLGESKSYTDFGKAVTDALESVTKGLHSDYMNDEFMLISPKIPPRWKNNQELEKMLDGTMSLDDVRKKIKIPVLIGYQDQKILQHCMTNDELRSHSEEHFVTKKTSIDNRDYVKIHDSFHFFLVPYPDKASIVKAFDERINELKSERYR